MVYYRKYRPQTIAELDLGAVKEKLSNVLSSKDIPHAFLFTGSKGLGKTSAARILAKAVNCTGQKPEDRSQKPDRKTSGYRLRTTVSETIEPCNNCEVCTAITNGSHIDVLEIDAASNRGVDEIRTLRERVKYSPSNLRKKVYIIDEVHMLTTEAFNALLKTLEEPPDHAIFVLATTEIHKVPATIISRTFQVPFERPTEAEVVSSLTRIVEGEGLRIDIEVLKKIYTLSESSFRDASKILEELVFAANGDKITLDLLDRTYKTESIESAAGKLLIALGAKNAKESLKIIEELNEKGVDFRVFVERLVEGIRELLLSRHGFSKTQDIAELTNDDVKRLLALFSDAYKDIKTSVLPQLPLEIVVVEFCTKESAKQKIVKPQVQLQDKVIADVKEEKKEKKPDEIQISSQNGEKKSPKSADLLHQLIDVVKGDNQSVAALLRGCKTMEIEGDKVMITAPYEFHGKKLKEEKSLEILEKGAKQVFSKEVRVSIEISS